MLQMKFKPRFIEAFASGQKITSLRMMAFNCFTSDRGDELGYFHTDSLTKNLIIPDYSAGATMLFDKGAVFTRITDFAGLLKRQPYQPLSNIELVTEIDGETVPFAVAFINDISVIKGDQITDEHAIRDGFNPEKHPLTELFVFMRDVYSNKDPLNEMYWLYTFTNIQMLPMQGGAA
ncbi:hypothetical protein XZ19_000442 [Salmonella enterica subsp. enterica]|nr:hypothetical protein [Salmonella enterica]EED7302299.1 hypothetical protein [Salmonella enterica subsp. enterica]EFP1691474.1 hypothetical protein [Salmonella enterica]EHP7186663.1 hypothetical protein [Salmonella enterica subsp. enterica serovar Thompson]